MQSLQVDNKLATLFQNYGDQDFVRTAQKEVEQIRRSADNFGIFVSLAACGLNEVARLTLRSRKSKCTNLEQQSSNLELKMSFSGSLLQRFCLATVIINQFMTESTTCGASTKIEKVKVSGQPLTHLASPLTTSKTLIIKSIMAST